MEIKNQKVKIKRRNGEPDFNRLILPFNFCLLPSKVRASLLTWPLHFCLLPFAFCFLPSKSRASLLTWPLHFCLLPFAFCFLPSKSAYAFFRL